MTTSPTPEQDAMQGKGMVVRGMLLACLALASGAACAGNAKLAALVNADQADRSPGSNQIDWSAVGPRDAKRREQVLQMLRANQLKDAQDFTNAALIFQHGDSADDSQLALSLATIAHRLDPSNRDASQLMANAWDRSLVRAGQSQWYGTQFFRSKTTGKWQMYPVVPNAVTEAQRKGMGLPTMADTLAHLQQMNK
jgi:hypothetical protein